MTDGSDIAAGDGWPDPSNWIASLHEKLDAIARYYKWAKAVGDGDIPPDLPEDCSRDPDRARGDATVLARLAVQEVTLALHQLPAFKDGDLLLPLSDLIAALEDLNRGRRPVILETRSGAAKQRLPSVADEMMVDRVVLSFWLLKTRDPGEPNVESVVARIFSKAGWRGRQDRGGALPLSPKTVFEWAQTYKPSNCGSERQQRLAGLFRDFTAAENWPPARNDLLRQIAGLAGAKHLRTKRIPKIR